MLIYLTIFFVFVFTVVLSAATGFVFYEASTRLRLSKVICYAIGIGVSVLISCIMTKLLLFGAWYFYFGTLGISVILCVLFIQLTER